MAMSTVERLIICQLTGNEILSAKLMSDVNIRGLKLHVTGAYPCLRKKGNKMQGSLYFYSMDSVQICSVCTLSSRCWFWECDGHPLVLLANGSDSVRAAHVIPKAVTATPVMNTILSQSFEFIGFIAWPGSVNRSLTRSFPDEVIRPAEIV